MMKRLLIGLMLVVACSAAYAQADYVSAPDNLAQDGANVVEFYPNPAVDYLSVKILNSDLSDVQLELFSILGNKLNISAEILGGDRYRFDVQELEAGYYLLVVRDPTSRFRETYKFLKK